jgi:hypothetical protein
MTTGQSLALDEWPLGNPAAAAAAAAADYGRDGDLGGGFVCNIRSSGMLPSARPAGNAVKAVVDDAAASTLC